MQRFTELKVWQQGHALVLNVYKLSTGCPVAERYGPLCQLRQAARPVPTNITEGAKRAGRVDYARFLNIAQASLIFAELTKMLHGLRRTVEPSHA